MGRNSEGKSTITRSLTGSCSEATNTRFVARRNAAWRVQPAPCPVEDPVGCTHALRNADHPGRRRPVGWPGQRACPGRESDGRGRKPRPGDLWLAPTVHGSLMTKGRRASSREVTSRSAGRLRRELGVEDRPASDLIRREQDARARRMPRPVTWDATRTPAVEQDDLAPRRRGRRPRRDAAPAHPAVDGPGGRGAAISARGTGRARGEGGDRPGGSGEEGTASDGGGIIRRFLASGTRPTPRRWGHPFLPCNSPVRSAGRRGRRERRRRICPSVHGLGQPNEQDGPTRPEKERH